MRSLLSSLRHLLSESRDISADKIHPSTHRIASLLSNKQFPPLAGRIRNWQSICNYQQRRNLDAAFLQELKDEYVDC
jgi:hypothetical protein